MNLTKIGFFAALFATPASAVFAEDYTLDQSVTVSGSAKAVWNTIGDFWIYLDNFGDSGRVHHNHLRGEFQL